jgi:hypothetical protein
MGNCARVGYAGAGILCKTSRGFLQNGEVIELWLLHVETKFT